MAKKQAPLFDAAEYLDNPEIIISYVNEALKSGDIRLIAKALGTVARAEGMTHIARAAGLNRESLYRALGAGGHPEFSTVMKVLDALGVQLVATRKNISLTAGREMSAAREVVKKRKSALRAGPAA